MVAQDVFKLRKLLGDSSRKILSVEFDELLDFAKQLNWNEDRLRKIVRASSVQTTNCYSLDADVGGGRSEGREFTLADTMTASSSATSAANGASDFRMTVESVLDKRAERNARIIRLRFGLENGVEHTYAQIATILGLSSQRVCNVVNQELRYLKDMSSLRAFKDGLEDSSP
jgi:DNA-directed RNA polymerase sigma subunit (sigma70/sigma32)